VTSGRGVVLDAGAFIALERRSRPMVHLARRFAEESTPLVTSAGVVAQVWRGGGRAQVPIAFLLRRTLVVDLTHAVAKTVGKILGMTRTRDPIDAHVVLLAREHGWAVLTSDPDDLRAIDPNLSVQVI
jgi:predicted nucleic acid-binding protein